MNLTEQIHANAKAISIVTKHCGNCYYEKEDESCEACQLCIKQEKVVAWRQREK